MARSQAPRGSTRLHEDPGGLGELIEICSFSIGYGGTADSLLTLVQDTSNEFELAVDVVSVDGRRRGSRLPRNRQRSGPGGRTHLGSGGRRRHRLRGHVGGAI